MSDHFTTLINVWLSNIQAICALSKQTTNEYALKFLKTALESLWYQAVSFDGEMTNSIKQNFAIPEEIIIPDPPPLCGSNNPFSAHKWEIMEERSIGEIAHYMVEHNIFYHRYNEYSKGFTSDNVRRDITRQSLTWWIENIIRSRRNKEPRQFKNAIEFKLYTCFSASLGFRSHEAIRKLYQFASVIKSHMDPEFTITHYNDQSPDLDTVILQGDKIEADGIFTAKIMSDYTAIKLPNHVYNHIRRLMHQHQLIQLAA